MIKATSEKTIEKAFGGRVPFFQCKEVNACTNDVTLYDEAEADEDITTTLWISDDEFTVSVDRNGDICTEEAYADFTEAWAAYKRQAGEHTSGL